MEKQDPTIEAILEVVKEVCTDADDSDIEELMLELEYLHDLIGDTIDSYISGAISCWHAYGDDNYLTLTDKLREKFN